MGTFVTQGGGEGGFGSGGSEAAGGGVSDSFGNLNKDDGTPLPESERVGGVVIGQKDKEIILIFPDTGIGGPGYASPGNGSTPGSSPGDQSLSAGFSMGVYANTQIPIETIDVGSVSSQPNNPLNPQNVEEEPESLIINIIDDDSIALSDVEIENRTCPLPVFNLSFESSLDFSQGYYNPDASEDAIISGNAAVDPEEDYDEGGSGSGIGGGISIDAGWAGSVAEIIDSIISVDENIKMEEIIDVFDAKWQLGNQNTLTDLLTSVLGSQREIDFGYFVNETNYKDFAETQPGGPDTDEIVRPFDVSGFILNGLSSNVYSYGSGVNDENDVVSLSIVDTVTTSQPNQAAMASMFRSFF